MQQLKDKNWRLSHLYKIVNKDGQSVLFNKNRAQADFDLRKHSRNIILKSRQLGFTTFEAIDSLDDTLWTPNFKAMMLSYNAESAIGIFDDKIDYPWGHYPKTLKQLYTLESDTQQKLKFGFGDGVFSSIAVRLKGRSGTHNRIHVSEMGKICKDDPKAAKEIVSGTFQTVPPGGRIDIESTAEGAFGLFYDMFWDAWNRGEPRNDVEFKAHFYNWLWDDFEMSKIKQVIPLDMMDSRDFFEEAQRLYNLNPVQLTYYYMAWLECLKDVDILHQEYPITPEEAFVASGKRMFPLVKLIEHEKRYGKQGRKEGNWEFFDEPINGHDYAMGADPSEGVGRDNATAVLWDFTYRPKVVAVYAYDKIAPDMLAYELKQVGLRYNQALIGVERNNHGHTTLSKLKEIYPLESIYKETRKDEEDDKEVTKLGWHTNAATKPRMIYDFITAITEEFIEIPSLPLLNEMKMYDRSDLDVIHYNNPELKHFDRTIAAAIGFQMKSHFNIGQVNKKVEVDAKPTYVDLTSAI